MHVQVYLENLIGVIQGGHSKMTQTTRNLFSTINELFHPKNKMYMSCEEPILLNKLCKEDASWSTNMNILVWEIGTVRKLLILKNDRREDCS